MQALTCVYKASVLVLFTVLYVHISENYEKKTLHINGISCKILHKTMTAMQMKTKTITKQFILNTLIQNYTLQPFFHGIFIFSFFLILRFWNIIITIKKYLLLQTEETSTGAVLLSSWEDEAWSVQLVSLVGWGGCCPWFQKHSDSWTWSKTRLLTILMEYRNQV